MSQTPYCKRMSRLAMPMTEGEPVQEMLSLEDARALELAANGLRFALEKSLLVLSGQSMTKGELIAALTSSKKALAVFATLQPKEPHE